MQQAVLHHFPDAQVAYKFTNRSKNMRFTRSSIAQIQKHIDGLQDLALAPLEDRWLAARCPYLSAQYRAYLRTYRFRPSEQVELQFEPEGNGTQSTKGTADGVAVASVAASHGEEEEWGQLHIMVRGKWADVILYEVPLMAIVSATYFTVVDQQWSLRGQRALARQKGSTLVKAGIRFSEFGTRRRRSYEAQRLVVQGLIQGEKDAVAAVRGSASPGKMMGTSNVHFAQLYDLMPVGTMAHEWTMGIAALQGYAHVNLRALQYWDAVYSPPHFVPASPAHDLTIALTDTFSTRVFWEDLLSSDEGREIAKRWRGLRQDSGDSKEFARYAKAEYTKLGVDPKSKVVIYSDGLDVERCLDLAAFSEEIGIGAGFGVGTYLTNDFRRDEHADADLGAAAAADPDDAAWISRAHKDFPTSKALNIVIKLNSINGRSAVKISDDLTKNTGDHEEVRLCKRRFGLEAEGTELKVEDA